MRSFGRACITNIICRKYGTRRVGRVYGTHARRETNITFTVKAGRGERKKSLEKPNKETRRMAAARTHEV